MKRRRIIPRPHTGTVLLTSSGRGGPVPPRPLPPGRKPAPAAPPPPNPLDAVTKSIADALGTGFTQAVQSVLGPGQVLLGVVLVATGLLLATGQMGKVGRAGLFVATRGAVK